MKGHRQTTDGVGYETEYAYNLSGAMVEQRYPSGRVVKNVLDNNGDLSLVQSKKNSAYGFFTYANSFTYNPAGAVTSMQLGNGRWESTQFNSRLQPTQIALGTTNTGELAYDKLKLDYSYGTTDNNGNVLSQDITVKRSGQSDLVFNQTYTYDALNRIKAAEEKTGTTTNWRQTFVFDRYGNRNFDTTSGATTTLPENFDPNIYNPTVNTANNRFASGQGWNHDAVGNVITDPEGRTFAYDAENKQTEVEDSSSQTIGEYFLDGDGKRVKKHVPSTGEVTVFVYDAGAKLIGEYSTIVETQDPKVQYLTNDHLGSPRINTDQNGHLTSRTDYMPYGEEIVGLGNRTANENYVTDDVRQGFTGYERDIETDLDFAQARYYNPAHGRFSSMDPVLIPELKAPQLWNKYSYSLNSPLRYIDVKGKYPTEIHNLILRLSLPALPRRQMDNIEYGNYRTDMPTTVLGYYANYHAMCKRSQNNAQCFSGVVAAAQEFIPDAIRSYGSGDLVNADYYFGMITHPLQDGSSPAHRFKTYDDTDLLLCGISIGTNISACNRYRKGVAEHKAEESSISHADLNFQIKENRTMFESLFGKDRLIEALGIFATAEFAFDGPIDGTRMPTVRLKDLGTVTVFADGRETYDGPLKWRPREK